MDNENFGDGNHSCTFTATPEGKIRIDTVNCRISLRMTSPDNADASWLINAMGFTPNVVNGRVESGGEGGVNKTPTISHRWCNIVSRVAQRVTTTHNTMSFKVQGESMKRQVKLSTAKDFPNQSAFVDELNARIDAAAGLKTALAAVKGYVRFNLVPATSSVPEHISVTVFMADAYLDATSNNGADIVRLIGRNFINSAGSVEPSEHYPVDKLFTFSNATPLVQMPRNLYIYLPDLIANSNVGGIETTLLRCVQMIGDIGSVQTYEPQYIQWHDVTPSGMRLEQIHVVIRNGFGDIVQFEWGSITATIMFRPIMAAIVPAGG